MIFLFHGVEYGSFCRMYMILRALFGFNVSNSWCVQFCYTGSAGRVVVPNLAASSLARADPPWQLSVGAWDLSASFSFRNLPNRNLAQGK